MRAEDERQRSTRPLERFDHWQTWACPGSIKEASMGIDRTPSREPNALRSPKGPGSRGAVRLSLIVGLLVASLGLIPTHGALAQGTATPPPSGAPAASTDAVVTPATSLSPVEDAGFGYRAVVPSGWTNQGRGIFTPAPATAAANDQTLLTLQSAPLAPDALWASLEPQLALTAPPPPVGTRDTAALQWTLYRVDIPSPTGETVVDLAMAQSDGRTWLVSLWSAPDESARLYEDVFLPVLDAFTPLPTATASTNPSYEAVEVTFPGGATDVTLSGTLTLPRGAGPHPGIVLSTGSGPQDRDESIGPLATIKPFALIADALSSAGVAVLRFDDRGVARSTGDYASASVADFTGDAEAAVRYLRSRSEIDPARVGVLGHSEGGIVVASLAAADPTLAFVVAAAAPAVPGVDLLVAQAEAVARASGQGDAEVTALGERQRALLEAVRDGRSDEVRSLVGTTLGEDWDRLTPSEQEQAGPRDDYVRQSVDGQVAQLQRSEFTSIVRSDAGADWRKVTVPVLAFFGGKDVQVPADQNAPALKAELSRDAQPLSRIVVLPDANHLFQPAVSGSPSEYGTLPQEFTAEFLPTLVDWVTARVSGVEEPGVEESAGS
jgi:pimeloyl-ACP methyl ester carboxylesterase